jgi:hypothetical protein
VATNAPTQALEKSGNGAGHGGPARGYSWPPFEPGNEAALVHGATSERHIRPLARNQKRRVLRQMGLRVSDLNPVGRALLEHYVRLTAKVVLIDRYLDEVGVVDEHGQPQPSLKVYVQLHRAALNALGRLEAHMDIREPSLEAQLLELRRGA